MKEESIDLSGREFGRWVVLNKTPGPGRQRYYCRCSCGNAHNVFERYLLADRSTSCKRCCRLKPAGHSARNQFYSNYRTDAKRTGKAFELSIEQFAEICNSACHYCGEAPNQLKLAPRKNVRAGSWTANGIDRVDNSKGYVLNNCVPCCAICNLMKRTLDVNVFLSHIVKIAKHQTKENKSG